MDESLILVAAEEPGERIDSLLARSVELLSRNAAQQLLSSGKVLLNGIPVRKNYRCTGSETFTVLLTSPEEVPLVPQDIPLDIIFEDQDLIVVNKDRGLVVHPAPGHPDNTLVNALLYHCGSSLSGIGGEKRPGIVHRIDKDTSGLVIAAKNDFSHRALSAQLSDHTLHREYLAVVRGRMREDEGTVDAPIARHPTDRKRMSVSYSSGSRPAVTHWSVQQRYRDYTLLKCILETGRTHQIRVHLSHIGHPLLGDGVYGAHCPDKGLSGQCLHAAALHFLHPRTGEPVFLQAALPPYFQDVLKRLGPPLDL